MCASASAAAPRVLFVVDRPGWAHDRKTDALARALAPELAVVKRFHADVTAADVEAADAVVFYYWLQVERLPHLRAAVERRRARLAIGVCSHYELEGEWRAPGLALLDALPRAVFVNNRRLLDELQPRLGLPLHYTPNGVDSDFFRPTWTAPPAPALRVGWAGSLANQGAERRGVHEVIAPAVARTSGAELRLAVREERWRDAGEMRDFYRDLDVYVCASRDEGTPNPCLEAAACGVPLVTTAVGNMPELVRDGENGFLVPRSPEAVAERLERLRDDPALRRRMGLAARQSVAAWDWRRQARAYREMLLPLASAFA